MTTSRTDAPAAIDDLGVAVNAATGSVDLTWTATGSAGYVGTATDYEVRRSLSPISDEDAWDAAVEVAQEMTPLGAGEAETLSIDPSLLPTGVVWHFAVRAVVRAAGESPRVSVVSNPAQLEERVLTIELSPGWNLVSVPFDVARTAFGDAIEDDVLGWDDGDYVATQDLQAGLGYWVRAPAAATVVLSGTNQLDTTVTAAKGWQLVGTVLKSDGSVGVTVGSSAQIMWAWDASAQTYAAVAANSYVIGQGYWVHNVSGGSRGTRTAQGAVRTESVGGSRAETDAAASSAAAGTRVTTAVVQVQTENTAQCSLDVWGAHEQAGTEPLSRVWGSETIRGWLSRWLGEETEDLDEKMALLRSLVMTVTDRTPEVR